jgi:hypothetical protein
MAKVKHTVTLNTGTITFRVDASDGLNDIQVESLIGQIEDRLEMGLQAIGDNIKSAVGNGKLSFKLEVK